MDATRPRRSRDQARQRWYGSCRTIRLARHMQFLPPSAGQLPGRDTPGGWRGAPAEARTRD